MHWHSQVLQVGMQMGTSIEGKFGDTYPNYKCIDLFTKQFHLRDLSRTYTHAKSHVQKAMCCLKHQKTKYIMHVHTVNTI